MSLFDSFYTYTMKPQSHQKSPGFGLCFKSGLTDIHETFGKHGPSFEQGWVEYFFHVGPVWNSEALAGFPLEFHIQTTQSFRVKIKGVTRIREKKTATKQEKKEQWSGRLPSLCHLIWQWNLQCLQHCIHTAHCWARGSQDWRSFLYAQSTYLT